MKKTLTIREIELNSGCYHKEQVNPLKKMPYYKEENISTERFLSEKSMSPQDRLWFLINGCELDDDDENKLIEVFKELHPKHFALKRAKFDDYVRAFNKLFYKKKKITKLQVEKILKEYLK